MLQDLLGKGYFPQELPPPFQTSILANAIIQNLSTLQHPLVFTYRRQNNSYISRPSQYNLVRAGSLRRILSIPNPINFIQLAYVIDQEWASLDAHLQRNRFSLSKPTLTPGVRALNREVSLSELPEIRANIRSGCRYLLRTDINSFYPSIYTHSVPWALHSKRTAKDNQRYDQLLGNKIDKLTQNAQDRQTKGVPIGPDTSLLVAEIILTAVDIELCGHINIIGFRYIDDYEICFKNYSDAENALTVLQQILTEYELQLGTSKTVIVDLPTTIEPLWVSELRRFNFRDNTRSQKADLIHYFDLAFNTWSNHPNDYILKYAISRSKSTIIDPGNWELYQNLLLNCVIAEPGALPIIIDQLKRYLDEGYPLAEDAICETFSQLIKLHALHNHSSEVSWAIWGFLLLELNIDKETTDMIAMMENPFVALLALDAQSKGLIDQTTTFDNWRQLMTIDELRGGNWLLAYEACIKNWLPPRDGNEYITSEGTFSLLSQWGVYFYNEQASKTYSPPSIQSYSGGGGGGGISPD